MSGGSWDYLCHRNIHELLSLKNDLQRMVDRLSSMGIEDAAAETYELVLVIKQYEVRAESIRRRVSPLWKEIEWIDSGDSVENGECLKRAIARYRGVATA